MHATCLALRLGTVLSFLVLAGCSHGPRPGVTANVFALVRESDGKAVPRGPATRLESAPVQSVWEIPHEDRILTLRIRKTEYEKATFEIVFPDQAAHQFRLKAGETRDVLPEGQALGLRIEFQESH
jgi:hypothetical protein